MKIWKLSSLNNAIILGLSSASMSTFAATCDPGNNNLTSSVTEGCILNSQNSSITVDPSASISVNSGSSLPDQQAGILATSAVSLGEITNHGTINGQQQSNGIQIDSGATVNGIINTWKVLTENRGIIINSATINSGTLPNAIHNTGKIKVSQGSGLHITQGSKVNGDIFNSGKIISNVSYGILNEGEINSEIVNTGTIQGSIDGIKNDLNGIIKVINNSGTISANSLHGIGNHSGTIGHIINIGTIKGPAESFINDRGATVTQGIDNYGTLDGNVELADSTVRLLGDSTDVIGTIKSDNTANIADNKSAVIVGDLSGDKKADFTAKYTADVGSIHVHAASKLTLAENNTWTAHHVQDGATIDGELTLSNNSTLAGKTTNNSTISLANTDSVLGTIKGDLINKGAVKLHSGSTKADNKLVVTGNYTGEAGSSLSLGTTLGNDASPSDKLIINGDANGATNVYVTNVNGSGDLTQQGIEIITIGGASNAVFSKGGRIVAGAYDYNVVKNGSNWYLNSTIPDPIKPPPLPPPRVAIIRPEAASYASNSMAANTMFNMRLHERLGETQYTDVLTGEEKVTNLWFRTIGGRSTYRDNTGQLDTHANRHMFQIGGDIAQWSSDGNDRFHLGLMAGYGKNSAYTRSEITGYQSTGTTAGYSAGLYGTWYANEQDKSGWYLDSWLLWNWFDNQVNGDHLPEEKYKSQGLTASLETGYSFRLADKGNKSYWLQPQAQVTWMNVGSNTHTETNGTRVSALGQGNVQTRLGARAYINFQRDSDEKNTPRQFQPFIETNWLHNTKNYGASMNGINNHIAGSRNIVELKTGVEGQITDNLQLWGSIAQQWGSHNYRDTQAIIGIKYSF